MTGHSTRVEFGTDHSMMISESRRDIGYRSFLQPLAAELSRPLSGLIVGLAEINLYY